MLLGFHLLHGTIISEEIADNDAADRGLQSEQEALNLRARWHPYIMKPGMIGPMCQLIDDVLGLSSAQCRDVVHVYTLRFRPPISCDLAANHTLPSSEP